jgi:hypothetical protein
MRISRKLLYTGVFLVAAGGVLLVAEGGALADDTVIQALRLWPVAIIAIGAGVLARRSRFATAGGVLAAVMPGLLLGGLVVAAPDVTSDCRFVQPAGYTTREGSFAGDASVELTLSCGELQVSGGPGPGWRVETGDTGIPAPVIDATSDRLAVASAGRNRVVDMAGLDVWRVTLPGTATLDVSATVNAGVARLDLGGTRIGDLALSVNAGEARADLGGASVERLSMELNAAAGRLQLPDTGDLTGRITINAGSLRVCAPDGTGLRIHDHGTLGSTQVKGLVRSGDAWESPDYATAASHADVTITSTLASVDINPEGGCQ